MIEEKERNDKMLARRDSGATLDQIAKDFGMSRSRASDIIHRLERRRVLMETRRIGPESFATNIENMPVDALDITMRTFNALRNLGCTIVGDILVISDNELLHTPNFGRKSLADLKRCLKEIGAV